MFERYLIASSIEKVGRLLASFLISRCPDAGKDEPAEGRSILDEAGEDKAKRLSAERAQ